METSLLGLISATESVPWALRGSEAWWLQGKHHQTEVEKESQGDCEPKSNGDGIWELNYHSGRMYGDCGRILQVKGKRVSLKCSAWQKHSDYELIQFYPQSLRQKTLEVRKKAVWFLLGGKELTL